MQKEAIQIEIPIIGSATNRPEFVICIQHYKGGKNVELDNVLQPMVNEKLKINNYSKVSVKRLFFTLLLYPTVWNGAAHPERKYYKRSEKHFYIDVRFPDYEAFCKADEKTALKIMAEQTQRGAEKFLSKVKDFDYQQFSVDLKELLAEYL